MPDELIPRGAPIRTPASIPYPAGYPAADDGREPAQPRDIREYLGVLRRHLWLAGAIAAATLLATGWFVLRQQRMYEAVATIRLVDTRRALAGNFDNSMPYQGMGVWTDPIESQMQVMKSRAVASVVVDSQPLGLRVQVSGMPVVLLQDVSFAGGSVADSVHLSFSAGHVTAHAADQSRRAAYGTPMEIGGLRFTVAGGPPRGEAGLLTVMPRSAAADMVLGGLHASQRARTDVVDVSYTASDPWVAQHVVNAAVAVFQYENAQRAQEQSRRRRIFLESQLEETDSLLRVAQDRLSQYRTEKRVYGSADAVVAAEQTGLLSLDQQRQDLVASRQVYQSLLGQLARDDGPDRRRTLSALVASPGIAENPVVQTIYTALTSYQASLDSVTVGRWASAPTNPDVQRLRTLVERSQSQLTDAVESQVTSLDARIQALDDLRARNSSALATLPATQAGEARLMEQVASTRNMADQLRSEYQGARVAEAVEAGQVEIVDLAREPNAPIGTSRRTKLLAGLVAGLLLGIGAAFLAERLNTTVRRRDEVESLLQVPGLAVIPRLAGVSGTPRLRLGDLSVPLPWGVRARRHRNGASLITLSEVHSGSAEAFRALRTNLLFSESIQRLRVVVVTSPAPQDGKTTTVANLAVTFAQQGMRVLLMDCDLRRARLHALFRIPREPGLTQLLLGMAEERDVLRPTDVEGLTLLSAGALPPNPSELLGGPRMREILGSLANRYDVVLLDTPPVHAAADALILGKLSDGVVLVLRAGHTERASARDAIRRLTGIGVRVVGAVLNDPDHKVPQYTGYYYYDDYAPEKV